MAAREHQVRMQKIATSLTSGDWPSNRIVLDCTPGGGKTGAATLLANHLLDAGMIDGVLWLVPRLSLAEQVMDAFTAAFGSTKSRRLEVADPQDVLFPASLPNMPACVGHVTTYQTVAAKRNYERFRDAVASRRVLVILDEVQFLCDEKASEEEATERTGWYRKVRHVVSEAAFVLVMTGTLWRTDQKRIPFIEYEKRSDGISYPLCDISYSLRDAIRERAVLPVEWQNRGGTVEYVYDGTPYQFDMACDSEDEESRKVRTFLAGEKAVARVLDDMVDHWRAWCRKTYQTRMLVMADDIASARRWRKFLQERHDIACVLATSKEEAAGRQLRHFRERKHGQCLVTVAMAYVGFDCPDLSHLAYLSVVRAPSWMLQSFARVSRFDRNAPVDYDHQHSFVFGPDDARFRQFLLWLRDQQEMGVRDRQARGPREPGAEIAVDVGNDFEPVDAVAGQRAISTIAGRISPENTALLDLFAARCPSADSMPRSQLYEVLSAAGVDLWAVAHGVKSNANL